MAIPMRGRDVVGLMCLLGGAPAPIAGFVTAAKGLSQKRGVLAGVGFVTAGENNFPRCAHHLESSLRSLNLVRFSFVRVGHHNIVSRSRNTDPLRELRNR